MKHALTEQGLNADETLAWTKAVHDASVVGSCEKVLNSFEERISAD